MFCGGPFNAGQRPFDRILGLIRDLCEWLGPFNPAPRRLGVSAMCLLTYLWGMTTLKKPINRQVEISGRDWIISFIPATPEQRFDTIAFRPKGKRFRGPGTYVIPVESARNFAAERCRLARIAEKKRLRKLRKESK